LKLGEYDYSSKGSTVGICFFGGREVGIFRNVNVCIFETSGGLIAIKVYHTNKSKFSK
jgi:hypothetical protein